MEKRKRLNLLLVSGWSDRMMTSDVDIRCRLYDMREKYNKDKYRLKQKLHDSEVQYLSPLVLSSVLFKDNSYIRILPEDILRYCLYPYINLTIAIYRDNMLCPRCFQWCDRLLDCNRYYTDEDHEGDISAIACILCETGFIFKYEDCRIIKDCLYVLSCDGYQINEFCMSFGTKEWYSFEVIYNGRPITVDLRKTQFEFFISYNTHETIRRLVKRR